MKRTTINRLMAIMLAVLLILPCFVACSNEGYDAYKNAVTGNETKNEANDADKADNANGDDANSKNDKDSSDDTATIVELQMKLAEALDKIEELEAIAEENERLKSSLEAAEAENAKLKEENNALKAEIEALKAQPEKSQTPAVEVIDGVIYCDVEYFLTRTTVKFDDGTAALKAITSGTPVVLDDVHAIGERANYRDNTFDLPRKGYNLAITFDGTSVTIADFSNYHWASNSLFVKNTATTGYELVETKKSSSMGNFDRLLQCVAVCVPNENAEFGYDFYVAAGQHNANPAPKPATPVGCQHGDGCHCGNCDKCPALEPEKVEVEVKVCLVCGDKACKGCVEVKTETETVYVPGETVYIPGETIIVDNIVEVPVKYCGRCGNLLEDCTCSDPGHNDRPTDTPNGGGDTTGGENTPSHNDRPVDNPGHNDRPTTSESSGEVNDDAPNYSERPTSNNPAHSVRP